MQRGYVVDTIARDNPILAKRNGEPTVNGDGSTIYIANLKVGLSQQEVLALLDTFMSDLILTSAEVECSCVRLRRAKRSFRPHDRCLYHLGSN